MTNNLRAFLHMLAISEGTQHLGTNGYNVIVGGELFDDYSSHPNKKVYIKGIKDFSTAAGRYQILHKNYVAYKESLKLGDFSPHSQDAIAIQLIRECKALGDIDNGKIDTAITKCRSRWASLPGAGYGQHENALEKLVYAYMKAGGELDVTDVVEEEPVEVVQPAKPTKTNS
jgi:muramidase (phage lysozyme)